MKRKLKFSGRFALTAVAAATLCLFSPFAAALGLGRLTVQSGLGEALQAEIEITSMTPEEQANLKIRVAPPEAYRTANVDYNQVLPTTVASLQRRPDGRMFVRLVSDRGVQEPFVDVILEISWATGRLVREYTLLFDPAPAIRAGAPTPAPTGTTTSPVLSATPSAVAPLSRRAAAQLSAREARDSARDAREASRQAARERRDTARAAAAESRSDEAATKSARTAAAGASAGASSGSDSNVDEYQVKPGDTLSKIAAKTQREGASLDQMLVALFRANSSAFIGNNMNRMKSGVVLSVPSAETAQGTTVGAARKTILAQSADFGAYRQRLAGSTLTTQADPNARQSGGKVQASVEDRKTATASTPDKLTLSKGTTPAAKPGSVEDLASKAREKQAADQRLAELNKNLADLKRIQGGATPPPAITPAAPPAVAPTVTGRPAVLPPPTVVAAAPASPSQMPPVVPTPTAGSTSASGPAIGVPMPAPGAASASGLGSSASVPAVIGAMPLVVGAVPTGAGAGPVAVSAASVPASGNVAILVAASTPAAARPASRAQAKAAPAGEPSFVDALKDNPLYAVIAALVVLLGGYGLYRFLQRSKKESGETSFLESRLQPDSFFGASGGQRIDTRDAGGSSSSMTYSLSQLDAIGDVDPVAEADVYLAYGRDLQAEEILKEAMRSNPERLAIRTKLLEVYAKRRDIKGFELLATQLFALTRGEGEEWTKTQELGAQIDPENGLYRAGGAPARPSEFAGVVEPLGASTLPMSVVPVPSQYGAAPDSGLSDSQVGDLDLDLDNPEIGVPSRPAAFDATESVPPRPAAATFQSTTLKMPLTSNESVAKHDDRNEPLAFDLSGISLDLDKPAGGATQAASVGAIELPFVEDGAHQDPLSRKLELAEEFQRIGDKDGARDLLREVLSTASGTAKTKAQAMLNDLG